MKGLVPSHLASSEMLMGSSFGGLSWTAVFGANFVFGCAAWVASESAIVENRRACVGERRVVAQAQLVDLGGAYR